MLNSLFLILENKKEVNLQVDLKDVLEVVTTVIMLPRFPFEIVIPAGVEVVFGITIDILGWPEPVLLTEVVGIALTKGKDIDFGKTLAPPLAPGPDVETKITFNINTFLNKHYKYHPTSQISPNIFFK